MEESWYLLVDGFHHRRLVANVDGKIDSKYPSWKLVSKNRKQWMKKPLKFDEDLNFSRIFITIKW